MKTIVIAGLLLFLSTAVFAESTTPVFAEKHASVALKHADLAVFEGKAGRCPTLVEHAKMALEHTLAASIVAKNIQKGHLDEAAKELQESIDEGNLGHADIATKHAEKAAAHIEAGNK